MHQSNHSPRRLARRTLIAGLASVALAAPHVARAAVRVARFGHNNTDDSHYGQAATTFAAAVAAEPSLNGVVKIEIYSNAQLGDDLSMLGGCAKGTLDGMLIGSSIMAGMVPEIGLINAPYLFADAEHARTVLDGPVGAEFKALARAKGVPVLAWGENGIRQITSNKPVRSLADLHGLKIRVPQSDIMLAGFRALGADAAPLSFGLLREALKTGEFVAQENAIATVETTKLYEVQKYLCLSNHIYDGIGFIASADLLEDLSDAQQATLGACAQKGAAVSRSVAAAAAKDGVGRLRQMGMTVVEDVDMAGLRAASRPFLESLSGTYGASRVQSLLAAGA